MAELPHQLAQVNVARLRAPLTDPLLEDFVRNLDPINALADQSPGFVWRLQSDAGDATSIRVFDDDMIIVNLSVWEDVDALKAYVYESQHRAFLRRRKEWFERFEGAYYALWWVPPGHRPTPEEAMERLEVLQREGESPHVFSFTKVYPRPERSTAPQERA